MSFASKIGKVLEGAVQTLPGGIQLGAQLAETRRREERQARADERQTQQDARQLRLDKERTIRGIAAKGNFSEALRQATGMPELQAEIREQQRSAITGTVAGLPTELSGALPTTGPEIESRISSLGGQAEQYGQAIAQLGTMDAPESQLDAIKRGLEEIQFERKQFEKLLNPYTAYASEASIPARNLRRESLVEALRNAGYTSEEIKTRISRLDKAANQLRMDEIASILAVDPTAQFDLEEVPDPYRGAMEARATQEKLREEAVRLNQVIGFVTDAALSSKEAGELFNQLAVQYRLNPESPSYEAARNAAMQTAAIKLAKTEEDVFESILRMQAEDSKDIVQGIAQTAGYKGRLRTYADYYGVDLPLNPASSDISRLVNTVLLKQGAAPLRDPSSDIKAAPVDIDARFDASIAMAKQKLSGNDNSIKQQVRGYLQEIIKNPQYTKAQKAKAQEALSIGQEGTSFLDQVETQEAPTTAPRVKLPSAASVAESTRGDSALNFLPASSGGTGQFGSAPITR